MSDMHQVRRNEDGHPSP